MRLFYCFVMFSVFVSCGQSVSKADLEDLWYIKLGERNDGDISVLIFEKDSIRLIYENNERKRGTYHIIENQLVGCFGRDTFSTEISQFTNDSFYFLDKFYHHDLDKNSIDYYKKISNYEIDLIDLKTNLINPNSFWHFSFYLDENASDSIKLHEQFFEYEDFLYLQGTGQPGTPLDLRIFVCKNSRIEDYKKLMYHIKNGLYADKFTIYFVVAQSDFNDFHYFKDRFSYWKDDFHNWQSNQKVPPPPPPPASFENTKAYYKDRLQIKINSSKDLEQLKKLNPKQKTLISYAANLDMKTYIQGQMIVLPLLKKDYLIRTEILGDVD